MSDDQWPISIGYFMIIHLNLEELMKFGDIIVMIVGLVSFLGFVVLFVNKLLG